MNLDRSSKTDLNGGNLLVVILHKELRGKRNALEVDCFPNSQRIDDNKDENVNDKDKCAK